MGGGIGPAGIGPAGIVQATVRAPARVAAEPAKGLVVALVVANLRVMWAAALLARLGLTNCSRREARLAAPGRRVPMSLAVLARRAEDSRS